MKKALDGAKHNLGQGTREDEDSSGQDQEEKKSKRSVIGSSSARGTCEPLQCICHKS